MEADLSAGAPVGPGAGTDIGERTRRRPDERLTVARAAWVAGRDDEARTTFLARSSLVLGTTLDSRATAESIARLIVAELADFACIDLWRDDALERVAVAHRDGVAQERLATQLGVLPHQPTATVAIAVREEKPQIGSGAEFVASTPQEAALLREFQLSCYLVVPLRSRGQTLGTICYHSSTRRGYVAQEFATATEFARRAAVALDNALLYESALSARTAAEAAQEQFRLLVNGLRESEDRYRTLFEESRDVIYSTRLDGRFLDVNPAGVELFGYSRAEMLRLNAKSLYADLRDRERFRREVELHGAVRDLEVPLRARDGQLRECLLSAIPRRGSGGEVIGYQGIIRDVTARKRAEVRLQASEHFTRTIIASVQQGIVVYDRDLRYRVWNHFMERITGVSAAEVLGTGALEIFPHFANYGIDELLQRALRGESVHSPDIPFTTPRTGKSGWMYGAYGPHLSPSGEILGVVAIIHDITERKQVEDQLEHNALHDGLTGLPNRALFQDRLERLLRQLERHSDHMFGVAFIDLDRFKVVNDSLGHLVGDELLVAIARRLESCIRQGDTVARLSGDEFAILINMTQVSDATRVAERILAALGRPFRLAGQDVFTSASIGIALSSTGYQRPDEILRDADTALYRAKTAGRSRCEVFDRNMHEQAMQTLQIEMDLRKALERQELRVHYQPIVSVQEGRVSGFEALVRWDHPVHGMIAPADFIPLAEETGLILPIGMWVLEEACTQMRRWLTRYPERAGMTMSVNLSTRQFAQPDLLAQVDAVLARTELPPFTLKLELTESAVVHHEETVSGTLAALRGRGILLCIDDFGTGYSSLSYLHSFPIDTLKIDRSFVSQIGFAGSNPGLVETIVALSKNLGMDTVAEGVETLEQLTFLRRLGPQFAQGYFFAHPQAPEQIEALLDRDPHW